MSLDCLMSLEITRHSSVIEGCELIEECKLALKSTL